MSMYSECGASSAALDREAPVTAAPIYSRGSLARAAVVAGRLGYFGGPTPAPVALKNSGRSYA